MRKLILAFLLIATQANAQYIDGLHAAQSVSPSDLTIVCQGGTAGVPGTCTTRQTPVSGIQSGITSATPITGNGFTNTLSTWTGFLAGAPDPYPMVLNGLLSYSIPNAVGDCATDDTSALQAALNAKAAAGGGDVGIGPHCYAILSAVLSIPTNVRLIGHWWPGSQSYDNYAAGTPYTLKLGTAYGIAMQANSALSGLILIPSNLTFPTSVRTAQTMVNAFAGTAITLAPGSLDQFIDNVAVFGFNRALITPTGVERLTIRTMLLDNTNGLQIVNSHDITRIENVHSWPFLTGNFPWISGNTFAISNATNSGGLVKITTAPNIFQTGDYINVHDVAGVPAANGRYQITVIDSSDFTLSGTTFAGTFSSGTGAAAVLDIQRRPGIAFEVEDSEATTLANSFAYDYTTNYHLGTGTGNGAGWTQLIGDSADSEYFYKDPTTTGLLIDGTAYGTSVIGGSYQSQGSAIILNSSATTGTTVSGATIDPGASLDPYVVEVQQGRAIFSGNQTSSVVTSDFYVSSAATQVILNGNDFAPWSIAANQSALNVMTGFGNTFTFQQAFGSLSVANVSTGELALATTTGMSAAGTNAATATPINLQRIYIPTVASGTGINIVNLAIGEDVIVWNGGANALTIYADTGTSTINGNPSLSVASDGVARFTKVTSGAWLTW